MKLTDEYKKYRSIAIKGQKYSLGSMEYESLINSKNLLQWESNLRDFIQDWMKPSAYIAAKTSGSTGTPKEITFHKDQMVASAKATGQKFNLNKGNKVLLCLPIEYIAGKMMVVRCLVHGLDLISIKPGSNPCLLLNENIDFAAMLPFQFQNAYNDSRNNLELIKTIILGGTKVNNEVSEMAKNVKCDVYETYGMTETLTHVAVKKIGYDTSFNALKNVNFDIDSEECLIIKAPHLGKEEIRTNDIVELISNTQFNLLGRRDNIINSGGIKIIPEQLEEKISHIVQNPFFICAISNKEYGERPILVVENKSSSLGLVELKPYFTKIEMPIEIRTVKDFLYTKSGKVDRIKTKKKYNLF
jgi:O-succinylbenzoic acid--CoA ligase